MKMLIGLGNPGKKYQNNRHNVGHMFIDYLINESKDSRINELKLHKTDCFMNLSGIFVKKIFVNWKLEIENLIIAHDDLDIPFGKFHIQLGVGPQLHNGLESIENHLKTKDFWRIRIGVDNREEKVPGEAYVLHDFTKEELINLKEVIFPKIFSQIKLQLF
jgi:peptidyl-tRNA hydrolase, PTH1 family